MGDLQLRPVGASAVLVELTAGDAAASLADYARSAGVEATEVVPGARSVLFDGVSDAGRLAAQLAGWRPGAESPAGVLVEIEVSYDGADLDEVADLWATDVDGVVARHAATEFTAAFCGFAPGFAYLSGLDERLAVPRLATPRQRVPAGSVALAGSWCGVYPTASPGGWRLIGRTDATMWDARRADPALLPPGTRVRFVPR